MSGSTFNRYIAVVSAGPSAMTVRHKVVWAKTIRAAYRAATENLLDEGDILRGVLDGDDETRITTKRYVVRWPAELDVARLPGNRKACLAFIDDRTEAGYWHPWAVEVERKEARS